MSSNLFDYTFFGGADPTFRMELKSNGHIVCHEHMEPDQLWCDHLEQAMRERWDSIPLFEVTNVMQFHLEVPIFPSHNLWTRVQLRDARGPLLENKRWQVWWQKYPEQNSTPIYICTLNPGEGRNVIRESLVEYMIGDTTRRKYCAAAHHGFMAEKEMEAYTGWRKVILEWCIYTTDQCIMCSKFDPNSADLVPPTQGNVWN